MGVLLVFLVLVAVERLGGFDLVHQLLDEAVVDWLLPILLVRQAADLAVGLAQRLLSLDDKIVNFSYIMVVLAYNKC